MELIMRKESALAQIVAWLKGKGLWEECNAALRIVKPPSPGKGESRE
jgi:hypothetical protein